MEPKSKTCRLPVTVVVATKNEEANIASCLLSLTQAHRVLVVDSDSTDLTQAIARQHGSEVINYTYTGGYPKKRQWALDHLDICTPWTMLIDADEQVPAALWSEIGSVLDSPTACTAYLVRKGFHFLGKRFRFGGFSHLAIMLFRTGHARFEQTAGNSPNGQDMEVHERLVVDGKIGRLRIPLIHDDCKGLSAYIDRHNKYSSWEAGIRVHFLKTKSWGEHSIKASMFGDVQSFRRFVKPLALKLPFEPFLWFLYHYVLCGAVFEGKRGYIASSLRRAYIEQVRAKVYELQLAAISSSPISSQSGESSQTAPDRL
jgi:glycosyltransferase involved in cell wall biosynthesis